MSLQTVSLGFKVLSLHPLLFHREGGSLLHHSLQTAFHLLKNKASDKSLSDLSFLFYFHFCHIYCLGLDHLLYLDWSICLPPLHLLNVFLLASEANKTFSNLIQIFHLKKRSAFLSSYFRRIPDSFLEQEEIRGVSGNDRPALLQKFFRYHCINGFEQSVAEGSCREEGKGSPVSGDKPSGRTAYYNIEESRFVDRDIQSFCCDNEKRKKRTAILPKQAWGQACDAACHKRLSQREQIMEFHICTLIPANLNGTQIWDNKKRK